MVLKGSDTLDDKDGELPGLGGRRTAWVDKETFLPLKLEDYAKDGRLIRSYEMTALEYDVSVPDAVFADIPPGGTVITESTFPSREPPRGAPAAGAESLH